MKRRMMTIWMLLLVSTVLYAQFTDGIKDRVFPVDYTKEDSTMIVCLLSDKKLQTPIDFAQKFLGRPYVAHTLEVNREEKLVVNTRQLDCTTLVETVTALVMCARKGFTSFDDYSKCLAALRYRNGKMDGYTSRLHYFSDWIEDKQQMGFVKEIQDPQQVFSALQRLKINYMSLHSNAYKSLREHPELLTDIKHQEQQLTGRTYRYIPKSQVGRFEVLKTTVKDGDIIAITCSKPGLDIAHLGFAIWHKDGLHLLNASQLHKKVIDEPMTLDQYLSKHPSHTGIRVIRIK